MIPAWVADVIFVVALLLGMGMQPFVRWLVRNPHHFGNGAEDVNRLRMPDVVPPDQPSPPPQPPMQYGPGKKVYCPGGVIVEFADKPVITKITIPPSVAPGITYSPRDGEVPV